MNGNPTAVCRYSSSIQERLVGLFFFKRCFGDSADMFGTVADVTNLERKSKSKTFLEVVKALWLQSKKKSRI